MKLALSVKQSESNLRKLIFGGTSVSNFICLKSLCNLKTIISELIGLLFGNL